MNELTPVTKLERLNIDDSTLKKSPAKNKPFKKRTPKPTSKEKTTSNLLQIPDAKKLQMWWAPQTQKIETINPVFKPMFTSEVQGTLILNEVPPIEILCTFSNDFKALVTFTIQNTTISDSTALKLEALCFYKSARQLYHIMTDSEKLDVYRLEPTILDTTEIPSHMAAAISMIGHIDNRIGRVAITDIQLFFKRWLCAGLEVDPDVEHVPPKTKNYFDTSTDVKTYLVSDFLHMIWRDYLGKQVLDYNIVKTAQLLNVFFQITISGRNIKVSAQPRFDPEKRTYIKEKRYVLVTEATDEQKEYHNDIIDSLGLTEAPTWCTDKHIVNKYAESQNIWKQT
ncbi:hypothetical protein BDF14DRAFT_1774035 [Spinellus fusiger]|nr:hypothetical protein BDF14DRAFT_1774035 [Spinellus fusiger]